MEFRSGKTCQVHKLRKLLKRAQRENIYLRKIVSLRIARKLEKRSKRLAEKNRRRQKENVPAWTVTEEQLWDRDMREQSGSSKNSSKKEYDPYSPVNLAAEGFNDETNPYTIAMRQSEWEKEMTDPCISRILTAEEIDSILEQEIKQEPVDEMRILNYSGPLDSENDFNTVRQGREYSSEDSGPERSPTTTEYVVRRWIYADDSSSSADSDLAHLFDDF